MREVEKFILVVTCAETDPLPSMSKCAISFLNRLSKNAFLSEFVVRAAATQMHSVAM